MQNKNNNCTPIPPPGTYATPQQSQGQDAPTFPECNSGSSAPRIVLGVVCGLVLADTVRKIILDIALLMPPGFVDAFDFVTFAASQFINVLFPLVLAVPPVILLVYAIRKKAVSDRLTLVMLVIWWATWVLGLVTYLTNARGVVPDDLFAQMMVRHAFDAIGPVVATVCVVLVQRGSKSPSRNSVASTDGTYRISPRIALGIVVGIVLVGCVFGALALVSSSMEQAQLAASGASGSEYLGSMVTDVVGIGLLAPAVPAVLLMIFAVRPTRSTRTAAIVGLVLWWALWVFAGFIMLPIQVGGIDTSEALDLMWVFFDLAIPPAVSTLCVWLAARGIRNIDINGGTL